ISLSLSRHSLARSISLAFSLPPDQHSHPPPGLRRQARPMAAEGAGAAGAGEAEAARDREEEEGGGGQAAQGSLSLTLSLSLSLAVFLFPSYVSLSPTLFSLSVC